MRVKRASGAGSIAMCTVSRSSWRGSTRSDTANRYAVLLLKWLTSSRISTGTRRATGIEKSDNAPTPSATRSRCRKPIDRIR